MPCNDIAVAARDLTKTYRIFQHPGQRLKEALSLGMMRCHTEFTALHGLSFEIARGDAVGIIGRNGSGKSTLLQIVCGILKPTAGVLEVNGRISALLELGAGFNPEFSGRENVYFQGALMGITRAAMDAQFDAIAAFADIGEFIDQPVRTYSSGMFVRLAFAVAVHVQPDILVVDEALAVGDVVFQKRCHARIRDMQADGLTLIFVSHDHELVRNLTRHALLLDRGVARYWGDTREATHRFRKMIYEQEALHWAQHSPGAAQPRAVVRADEESAYGIGGATLTGLQLRGADGEPREVFEIGDSLALELSVAIDAPLDQLNVAVVIKTLEGTKVYSWGSFNQDIAIWAGRAAGEVLWERSFEAGDELTVRIELAGHLGAGDYEIQAVVSRELNRRYGAQQILHWRDEMAFFRVIMNLDEYVFGGLCDLQGKVSFDA